MGQAVWSGSITFGLVTIPVRLYPATQPKDVRFHLYDRRTGKRVRYERVTRAEEAATFAPEPALPLPTDESQAEPGPATRSAPDIVRESVRGAQPVDAYEVVRGVELPEGDLERVDGLRSSRRSEEHTSELQSLTNLVCR